MEAKYDLHKGSAVSGASKLNLMKINKLFQSGQMGEGCP